MSYDMMIIADDVMIIADDVMIIADDVMIIADSVGPDGARLATLRGAGTP